MPGRYVTLPKDGAVERIPGDKHGLGRQHDRGRGAFVEDVEDPPSARHHRTHTRPAVVVPGPAGAAGPAEVTRRADQLVLRDGVALGVVEVVGPVVDLGRSRFDRLCPTGTALQVGRSAGAKHSHYLVGRDVAEIFGHHEIHEVVDVRQTTPVEAVDRHVAVLAGRLDKPSGPVDVLRVGVQPVDQVLFAGLESGRKLPVTAADVDDESAGQACCLQDMLGQIATGVLRRCVLCGNVCHGGEQHGRRDNQRADN